jgi:hypothetical protein
MSSGWMPSRRHMRSAESLAVRRLRLLDCEALLGVLEELCKLRLEAGPIDERIRLACLPRRQLVGDREHAGERRMGGQGREASG